MLSALQRFACVGYVCSWDEGYLTTIITDMSCKLRDR